MTKIQVDMALAYRQMLENPELLGMFNDLLQASAPKYEEVFSGWVVQLRWRKLDADKNPIGEWSKPHFRSASRSVNPYVYQKGRHGAKDHTSMIPEYDYSDSPKQPPNVRYNSPEWKAWREEYTAWDATKKIKGYTLSETRVIPAKIVVEA